METEVLHKGQEIKNFYRLELNASIHFLQPRLQLWGPLSWLKNLKKCDKIELKGGGQTLFTGKIGGVAEVERSQIQISVLEPLSEEVQLNFSKEKWKNILAEVWPEYSFDAAPARGAADFECKHYSYKCSLREHLVHLHSKLESRSKKNYCMYLDEQNRLQIHETGKARGNAEVAGVLIKNGAGYRAYNPFPLLVGMSSGEGIAERLELTISNAAERLRVWWSETKEKAKSVAKDKAKDAFESVKDTILGPGSVANFSPKVIYAIMGDKEGGKSLESLVKPVLSGTVLQGYIDGAVDVEGRQVYKMNENTHLTFDGAFSITKNSAYTERSLRGVKRLFGSNDDYGLYWDLMRTGGFQHADTGAYSKDMSQWWSAAQIHRSNSIS